MRAQQYNKLFDEVIAKYHIIDNVDQPFENPYKKNSFEHLLYRKNWIDTVQWHYEDIIRLPDIDPVEAITNFEHEHKPIESQKVQIASKLDNDNIIWATKEDTGVEINAVIKRAFKKLNYT